MNPMIELKRSIENLNMLADLEAQKQSLLSLVDRALTVYPTLSFAADSTHQRLSPRESEVMNMILTGRRLKEIAATLDISVKTVTTHRSRLLRKLNLEDNLGLYRYGIRNGLISV
jgi:DNA-binding NarL/FixJ family response regulator